MSFPARLQEIALLGSHMGLLNATWRVHASGVDDLEMIEGAIHWLTGDCCEVTWERGKSFHGSPQHVAMIRTGKRKIAKDWFRRLGVSTLNEIFEGGVGNRIDDDKTVHVRISLPDLCRGIVSLIDSGSRRSSVKGTFKIEAYPGDEPSVVVSRMISELCSES
jgi:RNA binding exosome subunit